jgi:serine/threonine-protein kinase HipA
MQTLGSLAHYDYKLAGAYSYEQTFIIMRQLGLALGDMEEQFRRMVFNVLARNQDDHVKNIAFLMDKSGTWSLSPAYDLTYSFNPQGIWTNKHQMAVNGKRDEFTREDLLSCAKAASIKNRLANTIIEEARLAVSQWKKYADDAGVDKMQQDQIQHTLRINNL